PTLWRSAFPGTDQAEGLKAPAQTGSAAGVQHKRCKQGREEGRAGEMPQIPFSLIPRCASQPTCTVGHLMHVQRVAPRRKSPIRWVGDRAAGARGRDDDVLAREGELFVQR